MLGSVRGPGAMEPGRCVGKREPRVAQRTWPVALTIVNFRSVPHAARESRGAATPTPWSTPLATGADSKDVQPSRGDGNHRGLEMARWRGVMSFCHCRADELPMPRHMVDSPCTSFVYQAGRQGGVRNIRRSCNHECLFLQSARSMDPGKDIIMRASRLERSVLESQRLRWWTEGGGQALFFAGSAPRQGVQDEITVG